MPPYAHPSLTAVLSFLAVSALCGRSTAQSSAQESEGGKAPYTPPRIEDIKMPWTAPIYDHSITSQKPALPSSGPRVSSNSSAHLPASNAASLSNVPRSMPRMVRDRVLYSIGEEGETWARGANYKASFSAAGATFIPFLGSDAPQNYPVRIRLEHMSSGGVPLAFDSDAAAVLDGNTVTLDHGSVREVYELGLDSMEQSFVIEDAPIRGDLVLRLAVESELERSDTAAALEFRNERGGVRYGRATVIDADGSRLAASTVHSSSGSSTGGVEIRVPASFLATARFPITIDPLVTTIDPGFSEPNYSAPDIAYEGLSNEYLVVCEEIYSLTDYDIVGSVLDDHGNPLYQLYFDTSSENWTKPRVATNSLSHQWLMVAAVGTSIRQIRGHTFSPITLAGGGKFTISSTPTYDCFAPDVGGDPALFGPTYYFVTWERAFSATDHDIHAQMVGTDSVLHGGTIFVETSGAFDSNPSVSKSDGHPPFATQNWNVVWQRKLSASNHDIYGAQIRWDGFVTNAAFPIMTGSDDDAAPSASSPLDAPSGPRNWLVAYTRTLGDHDILGNLMSGATTVDVRSLSFLEAETGSGTYYLEQVAPDVDSDGTSFTVAYIEQEGSSSIHYYIYLASFAPVGSVLRLSEGHVDQYHGPFFFADTPPQITSTYSGLGGVARFGAVIEEPDLTYLVGGTITGSLYDAEDFTSHCWPGTYGTQSCPCGNAPAAAGMGCNNSSSTGGAVLTEYGTASLTNDTAQFHTFGEKPTATSIVMQGTALANTSFGQGVRCAGGTLKRLYVRTASGGSITVPNIAGGDPQVSVRSNALGDPIPAGSTRYYLVYYRDPNVLGGCPSSSTFNATQGGSVIWRP